MSHERIPSRLRQWVLAGVSSLALATFVLPGTGSLLQAATDAVTPPVAMQSFADLVAAAKPAVVTVTTEVDRPDRVGMPGMPGRTPFDELFRQFFGQEGTPFGQMPQAPQRPMEPMTGLGSGFIVSADGHIVTNAHVVDGAREISVTLDDGREMTATLVGADAKNDLAVLKVEAEGLPTLTWGDSEALRLGDAVVAIGNPFGVGTTVTSGIVSARGRDLHNGPYDDFIQVDAAINRGNSGGPLLDQAGHVVGINTAIFSPNGGSVGVGFAIPSEQAEKVVADIRENGSIQHGYIGVRIQPVDEDIAAAIGLTAANGALVASVAPDGPASRAGLQSGDVIVSVDGAATETPRDVSRAIADLDPGQSAEIGVWRNGSDETVTVTTVAFPGGEAAMPAAQDHATSDLGDLGLTVAAASPELGVAPDTKGVVVTGVDPDGTSAERGLRQGDVITAVGSTPVASVHELEQALAKQRESGRGSVLLQVERGGERSFVAVPYAAA